jgi:hypothetical protein
MVQVLIFGSLIALNGHVEGPFSVIFGLGAFAFYFYMVVDSYQTARRRLMGLPTEEWLGLGEFKMNAPVGAILLIGLGSLFLLDNLGVHVFSELSRFWPAVLIVIGLVLLQRRMGGRGTPSSGTGNTGYGSSSSLTQKGGGPGDAGGPQGF